MDDSDTEELGRELANQVEAIFIGKPSAACIYALALVTATAVAHSERRDLKATMALMSGIVDLEVREIDALHARHA